jgi:hypothetical protein
MQTRKATSTCYPPAATRPVSGRPPSYTCRPWLRRNATPLAVAIFLTVSVPSRPAVSRRDGVSVQFVRDRAKRATFGPRRNDALPDVVRKHAGPADLNAV